MSQTISLSKIRPGNNPRRYFDQKKHDELVASLRLRGMLQPILLRPAHDDEGTYIIVAGGRRYRAALEAYGPDEEVPVTIRDMSDQAALEAAIDENDCRDDASETEQADAAVRVLAAHGGNRAEAAGRLGWSLAKLDRRLALAKLSDACKVALDERKIKIGHAELLAAVPDDKQEKALETILSAGLDVAKTREALMRMTQDLASAKFDKTECAACPFNSATQRALFGTHVDEGHCTNPGCFQLKTEADDKARIDAEAKDAPEAKAAEPPAGEAAAQKPAPSPTAPAKPAASAPAAPKVTVTAASVAARVSDLRAAAWRATLVNNADLAEAFGAALRSGWTVDRVFLDRFTPDELKFIAQECGLVEHMGAKKFANLLKSKKPEIIAGMLNATGFDWAGRLPGAMTLDGQYGPPAEAKTPETAA